MTESAQDASVAQGLCHVDALARRRSRAPAPPTEAHWTAAAAREAIACFLDLVKPAPDVGAEVVGLLGCGQNGVVFLCRVGGWGNVALKVTPLLPSRSFRARHELFMTRAAAARGLAFPPLRGRVVRQGPRGFEGGCSLLALRPVDATLAAMVSGAPECSASLLWSFGELLGKIAASPFAHNDLQLSNVGVVQMPRPACTLLDCGRSIDVSYLERAGLSSCYAADVVAHAHLADLLALQVEVGRICLSGDARSGPPRHRRLYALVAGHARRAAAALPGQRRVDVPSALSAAALGRADRLHALCFRVVQEGLRRRLPNLDVWRRRAPVTLPDESGAGD
jgi:hypothetical protein